MRGRNFGVCHGCRSNTHYFGQCQSKQQCPSCDHRYRKCFEVERDTSNKGRLFFTCSDDCGYFDWVKDEVFGEESSSVNCPVNHAPNKEDEELPTLFDGLARISEKRGVDISLKLTFSKGKDIAKCDKQGKGQVEGFIYVCG
ncbi:uncharacterized protein LOC111397240 [Olea europaea var. sylvestris]|uniref:uncharacterized protein LOC111397240 n=1 Tax=Olea europaea var. sylvestris TaxID=158386 RepID=UPI000C1D4A44|nr:uncharacterized protein LOC111397240 [Olea europaea var. sylvestris]